MNVAVAVLACLAALACPGAGRRAGAGGGDDGADGRAEAKVIVAAPTTFEVELTRDVLARVEERLASGSLHVARLVLRDMRPRAASSLKGVRVFVELPEADAATPAGDPHYAGSFVLGLGEPQTMLFNVAPTLARLHGLGVLEPGDLRERGTLRITFVPEPWEHAVGLGEAFALPFRSLEVEVP